MRLPDAIEEGERGRWEMAPRPSDPADLAIQRRIELASPDTFYLRCQRHCRYECRPRACSNHREQCALAAHLNPGVEMVAAGRRGSIDLGPQPQAPHR